MEIVQFFASNLRREVISALDEKVVIHYKDLFSDFQYEYDYQELVTGVVKGKTGDAGWSNTALFFFVLTVIIDALIRYFAHYTGWLVFTIGFILAIVIFCMRFYKYDFVTFCTSESDAAFLIKLSGKNRQAQEEFVNFLLEKIKEACVVGKK